MKSLGLSVFFGLFLSSQLCTADNIVEFSDDVQAAFVENSQFQYWSPYDLTCKKTRADYEKHVAQDKAAFIWKRMLQSRYEVLPEITGADIWGVFRLLNPFSNSKSFTHTGDFMKRDRAKDIHHFGTAVMVQFIPLANPFTGIFKSGADFGVARFSLARPADGANTTPGMGIKFFVDGKDSLNMEAMYRLTGQEGHDLFQNNFTSVLPNPHGDFMLKVLGYFFGWGLWDAGQSDGDPKALSSNHLAELNQDGSVVESPLAPFELMFEPTTIAQTLLTEVSASRDFRALLEGKGKGIDLYNVWGNMGPRGKMLRIGTIRTSSNFVASRFGDEVLYFRHHHAHPLALTEEL